HHAVDADHNQSEANGGENAHHDKAEARAGVGLRIQEVFKRTGVGQGDAAVGGPNGVADVVHQHGGLAYGVDQQSPLSGSGDGIGQPDFGPRGKLQALILGIVNDADDFEPRVLDAVGEFFEVPETHAAADGVVGGEIAVRE